MHSLLYSKQQQPDKWTKIMDENTVLCRDDVIWMLDYVKQRLAAKHSHAFHISQDRWLHHFKTFANTAMMLLHDHRFCDQDMQRIKQQLYEASIELQQCNSQIK